MEEIVYTLQASIAVLVEKLTVEPPTPKVPKGNKGEGGEDSEHKDPTIKEFGSSSHLHDQRMEFKRRYPFL